MLKLIILLIASASSHKLKILHPSALKKQFTSEIDGIVEPGLLKSSMGNFGHFNYGSTMRGRVHYPT